jgi:hypothetical protein
MIYLALILIATMVAVAIFILEHRGDPAALEKDYSKFAAAPTLDKKEKALKAGGHAARTR